VGSRSRFTVRVIPLWDNIPTRRFPLVTVALIALNSAVWVFYQLPRVQESAFELGFLPCVADGTCADEGVRWPADLFSAMFAHASWAHLLGNMLFLWIFGNNVEDAMGRVRFVVFYLGAGLAASAAQIWVTLRFGTDEQAMIPNLGASGAIAGVLGGYILLYPHARVVTLIFLFLFELPAVFFIGWWFLFQLWLGSFSLMAATAGGGVAFFAHIGGFVFGLLTVRLFARHRRPRVAGPG
jgi:membrane associated rhomboid family serine protease